MNCSKEINFPYFFRSLWFGQSLVLYKSVRFDLGLLHSIKPRTRPKSLRSVKKTRENIVHSYRHLVYSQFSNPSLFTPHFNPVILTWRRSSCPSPVGPGVYWWEKRKFPRVQRNRYYVFKKIIRISFHAMSEVRKRILKKFGTLYMSSWKAA